MNNKHKLSGVFTPLVTPFEDGKIRFDWLEANIRKINKTGVKGYLALGSNGEFMSGIWMISPYLPVPRISFIPLLFMERLAESFRLPTIYRSLATSYTGHLSTGIQKLHLICIFKYSKSIKRCLGNPA